MRGCRFFFWDTEQCNTEILQHSQMLKEAQIKQKWFNIKGEMTSIDEYK